MDLSSAQSGRAYTALPIDATQGFPQSFSFVLGSVTYFFTMYVDIDARLLSNPGVDLFPLPTKDAFLVARVDKQNSDNTRTTIFLRKLTPELEYEAQNIALFFPQQVVARRNLNGQGDFGSAVMGGIAPRWA
jgi:hypothetical protein